MPTINTFNIVDNSKRTHFQLQHHPASEPHQIEAAQSHTSEPTSQCTTPQTALLVPVTRNGNWKKCVTFNLVPHWDGVEWRNKKHNLGYSWQKDGVITTITTITTTTTTTKRSQSTMIGGVHTPNSCACSLAPSSASCLRLSSLAQSVSSSSRLCGWPREGLNWDWCRVYTKTRNPAHKLNKIHQLTKRDKPN